MCVCSLICCSVAIVTTFPILLLIQTGLKLCLVAALSHPPTITIIPNMNPLLHLLQSSPPCPRSASSLNQAPSSVSPVPVLSHWFHSIHVMCHSSHFILNALMVEIGLICRHITSVFNTFFRHRSFQNGCRFRITSTSTSTSLTLLNQICCRSQRSNTSFLSSCPLRVWSSTPPGPTVCQMTH